MSSHFAAQEFARGWRTLVAASIGNGTGLSGLAFYTFGVFVLPLTTAFGWSRGEVSIAASFLIVGTAITAPVIGTIIDRFGARRVGISSMLALAAGYAALIEDTGLPPRGTESLKTRCMLGAVLTPSPA